MEVVTATNNHTITIYWLHIIKMEAYVRFHML